MMQSNHNHFQNTLVINNVSTSSIGIGSPGKSLSVIFRPSPPGSEGIAGGILPLQNGTNVYLDGSGVDLMWDIRDALNLSLKVTIGGGDWNDAWNAVVNGVSEMGVTLRAVDMDQVRVGGSRALNSVSLLHPVLSMPTVVYFRQPFIRPYHDIVARTKTWIVFLCSWCLCIFACSCIQHYYFGVTSADVVLWAGAIIHGRQYPLSSPSKLPLPMTLAMLTAMLLNLITVTSYTAKIVSLYSVKHEPIKRPEDLIKFGYTFGSYSVLHFHRMFKSSGYGEDFAKTAVRTFHEHQNETFNQLFGLKNPNIRYAFMSFPDGFYYMDPLCYRKYSKKLCSLSRFVSEKKSLRSMFISKKSPLKDSINQKLLQLIERGINFRYQKNHRKLYDYKCMEKTKSFQEITLVATFPLFYPFIIGATASIIIEIFNFSRLHYIQRSSWTDT